MSLVRWKFNMQLLITRKYFKFIEKNEIDLIYVDLCTYFHLLFDTNSFGTWILKQSKRRTQSTKKCTHLFSIHWMLFKATAQIHWKKRNGTQERKKRKKERKKSFLNKSEIISFWLGYTTLSPRNTMMNATKSSTYNHLIFGIDIVETEHNGISFE